MTHSIECYAYHYHNGTSCYPCSVNQAKIGTTCWVFLGLITACVCLACARHLGVPWMVTLVISLNITYCHQAWEPNVAPALAFLAALMVVLSLVVTSQDSCWCRQTQVRCEPVSKYQPELHPPTTDTSIP